MSTDPGPPKDCVPSDDESDDLPDLMDWVRVLFLRGELEQMLMVHDDAQWDLPSFEYSCANSIRDGSRIDTLCEDVREWFQMDSSVHFAAVVELLGDMEMYAVTSSPDGTRCRSASLYVMQPHGIGVEDLMLPLGAEWKEVTFFSVAAEQSGSEDMRRIAKSCEAYVSSRGVMKDLRFGLGWHASASEYLRSVMLDDGAISHGHVKQVQVTSSSTVLKMNSSKGWYFAKASSIGNNEFTIAAKIAEIFPESSPVVVGTNRRLRCFVAREFEDIKPKKSDVEEVIQKLADMQLGSVSHVEELERSGCPIRDPLALKKQFKVWAKYDFTKLMMDGVRPFELMTPVMMDLCDKLQSFNIPNSLVHGDFALSNVAFAKSMRKELILFDWEYACIGHPFFDFHRLYEDLHTDVRDEVVEGYLRRWSAFGDLKVLKEAFEIARCLGKWLSLWRLSESLGSCEHEVFSNLQIRCQCIVNMSLGILLKEKYFVWPE